MKNDRMRRGKNYLLAFHTPANYQQDLIKVVLREKKALQTNKPLCVTDKVWALGSY